MHPTHLPPKKHLGQNFLTSQAIINKIISAILPAETDLLVEIGPGLGALTCPLLQTVKKLTAIEVDQRLIPILQSKCEAIGDLTVYHQDALTFDFSTLSSKQHALRLVGNLPYAISTPLLFHLISQIDSIQDMHFMLQKEVADRIAATPGSKAYGRLSVMTQYHCTVKKCFNVPATAFFPKPKVESAVIKLTPYLTPPHPAQDFERFKVLVRECFNHRRKTLSHTLKTIAPNIVIPWESLHINPKARPETLSIKDFVNISNLLYSHNCRLR